MIAPESFSDTSHSSTFGPDYYQTIYRHYERQNPGYKHAFYRDLILEHAGGSSARILDVGCAFGGFVSSMPDAWDRYGIDVSSFAIQRGRAMYPKVQLAAATLDTNPFDGPFDVLTSFDVIEHIQDLENVALHVRSLLRPGGLFVFVVPTYDGPLGPIVHLLDRDPTHIHKTNRKFWLDWAARHFEVEEWTGIFRMLLPSGPYIHWPARPLRSLAPAVLVAVRTQMEGANHNG
jgi:SAM-dependent methyltransferase